MHHRSWALPAAIGLVFAATVQGEEAPPIAEPETAGRTAIEPEIRSVEGFRQTTLRPSQQSSLLLDPAELLRHAPGAAVNKNGPLTGIS